MLTFDSTSTQETIDFAARLGALLLPGDVLLLSGPLGAGKTTFVQGLARGAGISAPVTSPTFTLIHEYPGPLFRLIHLDFYRLQSPEEAVEIGWEEYLDGVSVVIIEWPERLGPFAATENLRVGIAIQGEERRRMECIPFGRRYVELVESLREPA